MSHDYRMTQQNSENWTVVLFEAEMAQYNPPPSGYPPPTNPGYPPPPTNPAYTPPQAYHPPPPAHQTIVVQPVVVKPQGPTVRSVSKLSSSVHPRRNHASGVEGLDLLPVA